MSECNYLNKYCCVFFQKCCEDVLKALLIFTLLFWLPNSSFEYDDDISEFGVNTNQMINNESKKL